MKLQITDGPGEGAEVEVTGDGITIGRDDDCDLTLDDPEVSRRHASVKLLSDGRAEIADLDSGNGTFVNDRRLRGPARLDGGEDVRVGDTTLRAQRPGTSTVLRKEGTVLSSPATVAKSGAAEPMKLSVISGPDTGRVVPVTGDRLLIGRGDDCGLTLDDPEVSRHHASVKPLADGRAEITDLGSGNGTIVDGRRISAPTVLDGGEELRLGKTTLRAEPAAGRTVVKTRAEERPAAAAPAAFEPFRGGLGGQTADDGARASAGSRTNWLAIGAAVVAVAAIAVVIWQVVLDDDEDTSQAATSTPGLVDQVAPSVAAIYLRAPGGLEEVNGTGWVLDAEEGLIATNAHVLSRPDMITPRLRVAVGLDPEREGNVGIDVRGARVIGVAPCADLAVLRVGLTDGLATLPIAADDSVEQGEEVYALGYPENISGNSVLQVTRGVVSATNVALEEGEDGAIQEYPNVVQTDAAINPGNSGGPLVNADGELVGVNTIGNSLENQAFAIAASEVRTVTDQLRTGESIGWAGFEIAKATKVGALVLNAIQGTEASLAGFGTTPLVVQGVDNAPIGSYEDYCDAVSGLRSGDLAVMQVLDLQREVQQVARLKFE